MPTPTLCEWYSDLESNHPTEGDPDVKKLYSEEQIIGFLREVEAGVAVKECAADTASPKPHIAINIESIATFIGQSSQRPIQRTRPGLPR